MKFVPSTRVTMAATALALTAALAACGGSSHASTSTGGTASTAPPVSSSGEPTGNATGASFPGASGSVAAITGQSMEVQNQQVGQVTVSWTSATRFSQTVTVPASAVSVGDCVTVNGTPANGAIVATGVTISQPTSSGSCTRGFAGRGQRPTGNFPNRTTPTSGGASARGPGAGFGFATGKVTAVGATTMTVDGFSSANFRAGSTTPSTTPAASPVTVELKSTTTYRTDRAAAASNLAVGDCVTATGSSSSNGSVAATSVRITSTGGQACTAGFGRFGGGFGGGGGSAGGTSSNG